VKGGKYVYGWSEVGTTGRIAVPDEALAEYNLTAPCKVILLSGSAHSGGICFNYCIVAEEFSFVTSIRRKSQTGWFPIA
jgi:hypothetical protein